MINNNNCKNYKNFMLIVFLPDFQSHVTRAIFLKMAANVPQNGGNYGPAHGSGGGEGHNPDQVSLCIK